MESLQHLMCLGLVMASLAGCAHKTQPMQISKDLEMRGVLIDGRTPEQHVAYTKCVEEKGEDKCKE